MPYITNSSVRTYYEEHGSGQPVVFLHGFTLDRRMWRDQIPFLSNHFRLIIQDARGHGLSDTPQSGYSRPDRISDVIALIDHLGLPKVHLVGLSMGGSTAIGLALKHQERLLSMTLVDTGAAGFHIGKKIVRIDDIVRNKGLEAGKREWLRMTLMWYKGKRAIHADLMTSMVNEHSGAIWTDPMRGKYPPSPPDLDAVHTISVPTCIFVGEKDAAFLPLAKKLHQRIAGSIYHEYADIGHMLNIESPDRFNHDLKAFLESC